MASTGLVLIVFTAMAMCVVGVASQPPPGPPPPLRIANIYGNHMVLQQAPAKANIWGYVTKCDSTITATFNGKKFTPTTFTDTKAQCVWVLTLPPMKADTVKTYTISVASNKYGSAQISDVMFGDVWVCSGQSNMEFTVPQAFNAFDEIEAAANYPLIRLFTAANKLSTTPQAELIEVLQPWSVASPKSVGGGNWTYFSATCWFFGREIFKHLKYPVGLIATDWGGTPVEAWSSPDALKMCKKELGGVTKFEGSWAQVH